MSSISALKVALASRKREGKAIIIALLSFVFCFSSLKINIKADSLDSDAVTNIAYQFFYNMNFRVTGNGISWFQNYSVTGAQTGTRSATVYPYSDDDFIIMYYHIYGDDIRFTESRNNYQVGLSGNDNIYIARIKGNYGTQVYFNGNTALIPIYVGSSSAMPSDIRALANGENVQDLLKDIISKFSTLNTTQNNMYTRLGSIMSYTSKINTNTNNLNNKLTTTNNTLNDIKSYFESNNTVTNNNVTSNNATKSEFDSNATSLATFESNQGNNLNTNLEALNISSDDGLLVNSSFVKSALWVNSMFDRLIVGSPFELVLVFCLSIGIAFAMIGKVR